MNDNDNNSNDSSSNTNNDNNNVFVRINQELCMRLQWFYFLQSTDDTIRCHGMRVVLYLLAHQRDQTVDALMR